MGKAQGQSSDPEPWTVAFLCSDSTKGQVEGCRRIKHEFYTVWTR